MSVVYVLLLVYFLKGGSIVTNGVVAHNLLDCEAAKPLIVAIERKHPVQIGAKKFAVVDVIGTCVQITGTGSI